MRESRTDPESGGRRAADPSAPSDARLRRFAGYGMKAAFDAIHADLCRTLAGFDLHVRTFSALVLVVENPGARRSSLAALLRIDRGKLVAALAELEGRGLVRGAAIHGERRVLGTYPTPTGERLCARALRAVEAHEARVTSILNDAERDALVRSLRLVERAAKGAHGGAAP